MGQRRRISSIRWLAAPTVLSLFLLACSSSPTSPALRGPAGETGGASPQNTQRKTLTIAYGRPIVHIGSFDSGVAEFREIAHAGLLALDPVSNLIVPRLAEAVPSTDKARSRCCRTVR